MSSALAHDARPLAERLGTAPASLSNILVALDQSDFAVQALEEAAKLCRPAGGKITGIHAYAAKMHDRRFKQMEGGLPERYRYESEMEHQRDVHEDLIGKGLGIISDSYHDNAQAKCDDAGVAFDRLSPEGKNYSCIIAAARSGKFDLLAMGARGLGAIAGSVIGSVCERVVRRSPIDVLVIKNHRVQLGDGPIVVAVDGSPHSFGALKTALKLARQAGGIEVKVVAAYDPYYHYVAFNKIAGVLSDEAGKVFRFKEQEQLHEELIDDGIAKIYLSHLAIAKSVAEGDGVEVSTELVAGKPFQAIRKYVESVDASLLMVGKIGVHADDGLDIGGNTENLLRGAPCHIWISQATHYPALDVIAEETIMWSDEADAMMLRAPDFVRAMARTAVIRQAHAEGHTFITSRFVEDVMKKMMPGASSGDDGAAGDGTAAQGCGFDKLAWSDAAAKLLASIEDEAVRENIGLRAEKAARRDAADEVRLVHLEPFVSEIGQPRDPAPMQWAAAYLARLQRVPEPFRDKAKQTIEEHVRGKGATRVDGDVGESGFAAARKVMCPEPDASERLAFDSGQGHGATGPTGATDPTGPTGKSHD